jgi:DNA adenine methylase
MSYPSPLRYPGGKTALAPLLAETIQVNEIEGGTYLEPFAGGSGLALSLLFSETVGNIHLNDLDRRIYSFWAAILNQSESFLERLDKVQVNVEEWQRQREVMRRWKTAKILDLGFATFFLNRCNRSGVFNAGPIGGYDQTGNYKIDVRFNKKELRKKIERIALYRDRITVWNLDAIEFLKRVFQKGEITHSQSLVYMDPPYFMKAQRLYPLYFIDDDHARLAKYLNSQKRMRWLVSYDDTEEIRRLYSGTKNLLFMNYFLHTVRTGRELFIPSHNCKLPASFTEGTDYIFKSQTGDFQGKTKSPKSAVVV